MAGVETTFVPGVSESWGDLVVVGDVIQIDPHPNADRLKIATVDLRSEIATVVCGAPNLSVGQRVPFARLGALLQNAKTGDKQELTSATIRGVESSGMICSALELGLGENHEGILVLPQDSPVGIPLASLMGEDVFEIEVTANRGDCLSVLGIAHEIAAITGVEVTEPSNDYVEGTEDVREAIEVDISDPDLCYRYVATVTRGLKVGPSPDWMSRRLQAAGQRAINNVVDVTNYVMLEYGQPLHAFDLDRVHERRVVVRPSSPGEMFTALDGSEHKLRPPMLLITDPDKAIGLAGVIGGLNSEMTTDTTEVLLEAATFNAINTRRTAAALRVRTEASLRFEKGLNPELAERAIRRATRLIQQTAGGIALQGVHDSYPTPAVLPEISIDSDRIERLLGTTFSMEKVSQVLKSLGFAVRLSTGDSLLVVPPYWRTDVNIQEDVVEEIARTIGYDSIEGRPLEGGVPDPIGQPERRFREEVRDLLVEAGLQEMISHTLVSENQLRQVGVLGTDYPTPLRAAHPMSHEQEFLRTSIRGALLRNASIGLRQPEGSVALFEIGRIFIPREGDLPEEREMAAAIIGGSRGSTIWAADGALDFYDAKGVVEYLFSRIGLTAKFEKSSDPLLNPGRTSAVNLGPDRVGVIGELHPSTLTEFDFPVGQVTLIEIELNKIAAKLPWLRYKFAPIPRYPSAIRDLALIVENNVQSGRLTELIETHPLVIRASLFDQFFGGSLPPSSKSLAYRLEFQSPEMTLSTAQINLAVEEIVQKLSVAAGARLRDGAPDG